MMAVSSWAAEAVATQKARGVEQAQHPLKKKFETVEATAPA